MSDKLASDLIGKLDTLIALTAMSVLEKKKQKEQIILLEILSIAVDDGTAVTRPLP